MSKSDSKSNSKSKSADSKSTSPEHLSPEEQVTHSSNNRRGFITEALSVIFGLPLLAVPVVSGIVVFLDPLIKKLRPEKEEEENRFTLVTNIDELPKDGSPARFQIIADKVDAWNEFRDQPVGAVYLRRLEDGNVQAFNATCPHAGCSVDFIPKRERYECPCHNSFFRLDGERDVPAGGVCPSPRDLDALNVDEKKLKETGEVFVEYQNFVAAKHEKIPQ